MATYIEKKKKKNWPYVKIKLNTYVLVLKFLISVSPLTRYSGFEFCDLCESTAGAHMIPSPYPQTYKIKMWNTSSTEI